MPTDNQTGGRWPAPLSTRVQDDADISQIADAVVSLWLEVDQALNPIIGHRGVAALYQHGIKLTLVAHPWLAQGHQGPLATIDTPALKAALLQQTAAEARAGGNALLQSLRDLLISLVGVSLTDRLLRSVWAHSAGDAPAQDMSS